MELNSNYQKFAEYLLYARLYAGPHCETYKDEWTLQEFIFRRPEIGEKEVQVIIKGRF